MFKIIFRCLCLLSVTAVVAQPIVKFDKTEVDLGVFEENEAVKTISFQIKNIGNQPLVIEEINTSCGCVLSEYTQKPIQKDSSTFIRLFLNMKNRPGFFSKTITVTTNTKPDINLLIVKGAVKATPRNPLVEFPVQHGKLFTASNGFNVGTVTTEKPVQRNLEIYNNSATELKLLERSILPNHIKIVNKDLKVLPYQVSVLKISYDAKQKNDYGFVSDYIELFFDDPEKGNSDISISVFGSIEDYFPKQSAKDLANAPKFTYDKKEVYLGRYRKGSPIEGSFTMKNLGEKTLQIKKIKPSCSCVHALMASDKIAKDGAESLNFTVQTGDIVGPNIKTITLFTNDPINHVVVFNIKFDIFE